jgi:hypothetical protein
LAPPNRGHINSNHILGTHVPVEEPSTASNTEVRTAYIAFETNGTERTGATWYESRMRYFNARKITRPEAQHIRRTSSSASQSSIVVISLGSRWFDVRGLKEQELHRFVEQLLREELMADSGTRH